MDKYRRVRRAIRQAQDGTFDRKAAVEHPKAFQTVVDEQGRLVNRYYGPQLAVEALKKAKQGVR